MSKGLMVSKTSNFTMSRKAKAKWLKALRSGSYKQTRCVLANDQGFCCLGVLMRTQGVPRRKLLGKGLPHGTVEGASWGVRYYEVMHRGSLVALSRLNDGRGLTFKQIANIIEKQVPCHD
jgi:hypothetical protein